MSLNFIIRYDKIYMFYSNSNNYNWNSDKKQACKLFLKDARRMTKYVNSLKDLPYKAIIEVLI